LLENAIRHDLERHDGAGDIRVDVVRDRDRLRIRVSNSLPRGFEPNPGTGFGLTATRDRLSLIYGAGATCESGVSGDRFIATLDLPASAPVTEVRPH
jgi:LytS/YehU family sensor histidine kinase